MSDLENEVEVEETTAAKKKKRNKKKKSTAEGVEEVTEGVAALNTAEGADDDDDDADEGGAEPSGAKKKKKRGKKKKNVGDGMPAQDNSVFRCLGNWSATTKQTWPPTIPVHKLYSTAEMPGGEIQHYTGNQGYRTTSEEKRLAEQMLATDYDNVRRAAEVHRQVRRYVQSIARPGIPMYELCQRLEAKTLELVEKDGLEAGWGFPTGCSLNHVAAHYTPNYGDKTVLCYNDVCKLDFGVQVGGRIVDSAFTIAFNPKYDMAIKSTQEGTNVGIKESGVDARFSDIGAAIQEVIESYEVELDGTVYAMKPVRNLNGHSISPYQIHGGKSVPIVKNNETHKMEEGEFYAIETFASTGKGYVIEDYECSHYMKIFDAQKVPLRVKSAKSLLHAIDQNFGTLAFCRRWLDDAGQTRHLMALKNLVDNDLVQPYPPLCDIRGAVVTQMEHTILIKPTCKEVISRGEDY